MKKVVIESPYAGDVGRNTIYARRCMAHSISLGEAPFASHLLYTQKGILNDEKPEERKRGIECGYAWADAANLIVFYVDYGFSPGMIEALKRALVSNQSNKIVIRQIGTNENPAWEQNKTGV